MTKIVGFALVLVVAGLIGYAYLNQPASESTTSTAAPGTLRVTNADLSQYEGKVVLLDFWATWCGPCKMAMPGVQRISQQFAGRPVAVVGANCWERSDPEAYMRSNGYTYELMLQADDLAKKYGVKGIPTFVILSPKGEQVYKAVGYDPSHEQEIARIIEEQLAKNNL
jgi:thiol-disulfide isomerase/thioredoxin